MFVIRNISSGLDAPKAPLSVISPIPDVKVRSRGVASLSTVPLRVIEPPPEFMTTSLVKVILEASWIGPLVVRFALSVVVGAPT